MSTPNVTRKTLQVALDIFDQLRLDWIDLSDIMKEAVASNAAQINGASVEDQLSYLIEQWGVDDLIATLTDFASAG